MAEFIPSKKNAEDFNGGQKYINGEGAIQGDALDADMPNNVIEGFLYTQGLAVNQPDVSEANQVGTASVSIIIAADGSSRLKFSSLKGDKGVGISTIAPNGTDENGGNKYTITLDDGRKYYFVAPKGESGDTIPPATMFPLMDGTAQIGDSGQYADALHRHPSDTTKADKSDLTSKANVSDLPQFVKVTISTMGWTNNTAYSQTISGLTTDDFIQFVPDDASAETVIENNVRATGLATVVGGSSAQVIFQRDTVFVGSITGTILVIKAR